MPSAEAAGTAAKALPVGSAVHGQTIYLKSCAACHGDKGDARGQASAQLKPLPRDFTTGLYKFRSTASGEMPTDADLMAVIDKGLPGSQMPAWENLLTLQERADVLAYIKTLSPDFADAAPVLVEIPQPPPVTASSIAEGRMVYMTLQCWTCHGASGRGDGKDGKALTDDWGHPIRPRNLTQSRYRAGHDPRSVYRTFSTGLNGTPMPAFVQADFLIGSDAVIEPAKLKEVYAAKDIEALRQWLQMQPAGADINRMHDEQKKALAEKRKWALAHYVSSLAKRPNFLVRMFTEDTEVTP